MRLANLAEHLERLGLTVDDVGNVVVPDRTSIARGLTARLAAITDVCAQVADLTSAAVAPTSATRDRWRSSCGRSCAPAASRA
jgi:hypothetical protein